MQQALSMFLTDNNAVGINETKLNNSDFDVSVNPFVKITLKLFKIAGIPLPLVLPMNINH